MSEESNTEQIERKNPILAYIVKRVELAIVTGIMSGIMAGCHYLDNQREKNDVHWLGQHISQKQQQIDELKHENDK